jgi:nucleoside-diphosphate-sugar epimerase
MVSFRKNDFQKMMKVNREGTANIVNWCIDKGVSKLGYISSTAAIGGQTNTLTTEKTKWKDASKKSGYAITKYSAEKEVWRGVEEGLDVLILNPSVVIGAGSWSESSLTIFKTVAEGLSFHTPGQNAFVDARDVASTFVKLMESDVKNERFLCFSENLPFRQLLSKIAISLDKKPPSIATPRWLMEILWRVVGFVSFFTGRKPTISRETTQSAFSWMEYDNTKIKKALKYQFISIDAAIENAVKGKIE